MKYLVASDIHGSSYYAKLLEERISIERPDKIILLGDLYYHGPRNPLTEKYSPSEVSIILNKYKDMILCTRGNCDAEIDEMISEFPMEENITLELGGKKFFFTHGHRYNKDNPPDDFDALVYGHFHTGFIIKEDGKIYANPGSTTLPKHNTKNSYMIIDEKNITLKDINGEIIDEMSIN
jgi:putative phosphoesterase